MRARARSSVLLALALAACGEGGAREVLPGGAQRGAAAPDLARLATVTLDGEPFALGGPGGARLVEVWATWCEPCVRAAAAARPVLARHPRVTAFAVAVDGDRDSVVRHAQKAVGQVLLVRGGAPAAARAGFDRLPTFLALDAHGRVVGEVTGVTPALGAELDRLLRHAEGGVGERQ